MTKLIFLILSFYFHILIFIILAKVYLVYGHLTNIPTIRMRYIIKTKVNIETTDSETKDMSNRGDLAQPFDNTLFNQ